MAATTPAATFDWERALQQDRRLPRMQQLVESILHANFPAVADKLRKEDPPARQYATTPMAPAPVPTAPVSAVKQEMAAAMSSKMDHLMPEKARQSIPIVEQQSDYLSASESSEMDTREVDPMDELSDFETQSNESQREQQSTSQQQQQMQAPRNYTSSVPLAPQTDEGDFNNDDGNDVEMDEVDDDGDEEDEDDTACVVCNSSENEKQILLCDKCNGEYHLYCLSPPLTHVPEGEWFCPICAPTQIQAPSPQPPVNTTTSGLPPTTSNSTPSVVKTERQLQMPQRNANVPVHQYAPASTTQPSSSTQESAQQIKQEHARQQQQSGSAPSQGSSAAPPRSAPPAPPQHTSPSPSSSSVAHAFESDAEKSNQLLIHACQCDDAKCVDPVHREFCPHMKRFLRSACWASHSEKWRSFRVARVTAELFAYHALQCHEPRCNVPMCDQLRAEEFV